MINNNCRFTKRTTYGSIVVEAKAGEDFSGIKVRVFNNLVLEVTIVPSDNKLTVQTFNQDEVDKSFDYDIIETKEELTYYKGKASFALESSIGTIEVMEISDEAFQGIDIAAMGEYIAKVEFNSIDKALNIFTWNEKDDDFSHKYAIEMPFM